LRFSALRLIVFDVDGVLTDGKLFQSNSGDEFRSFNIRDGLATVLAQQAGLSVAWVTGRRSEAVLRRAKELGIPDGLIHCGARDKRIAMRELRERTDLPVDVIGYVGDDLNDLLAFEEAGLTIAVADAAPEVRERADFVTACRGGEGVAREVIERILREQKLWTGAIQAYLDFLIRPAPTEKEITPQ
jgi:3-deoxy-D-manno-octulosonate 8-phosphate phosphatase (KDO 8-P phosphatase)